MQYHASTNVCSHSTNLRGVLLMPYMMNPSLGVVLDSFAPEVADFLRLNVNHDQLSAQLEEWVEYAVVM